MNLQQFLLILRARYKIIFLVLLTTVAVTVAASLLLPAQYTATATVVVDVKSPDPIAGIMLPALIMPGYMATQVDIINSDRVALKVVKMLKLDQSPQAKEQWLDDTEGKGKIEVWLAAVLQKKLDVKPSRESNVISINYKAVEPAFAAAVANAFAKAYLDTNIELKVEPARQYAVWFDERTRQLRDGYEKAQAKLSAYQREHGIVANDERLDSETYKLNELSTQLTIVQGQTNDVRSKQRSGGASDTLPEVVQNALIMNLKGQIAVLEGKLQDLAGNVGRNHPQYQRQEAEIASLKQKLQAETQTITSGFSTSSAVGKEKEAELRSAIDAQKHKLLQLKRERDELAVLMRDVDAAQKAYELVTQRFNQTSLESQSTQTNVSVLTPATEPIEPSFPKLLLNIAISIFLGILLGVGAAFILEMLDQRVRSAEDLSAMLGLSVLGVISKTNGARRRGNSFRSGSRREAAMLPAG